MLIAYTKNANDDSNEFQVRKNDLNNTVNSLENAFWPSKARVCGIYFIC